MASHQISLSLANRSYRAWASEACRGTGGRGLPLGKCKCRLRTGIVYTFDD